MSGATVPVISASSDARSFARCRWPLTRRNCLPASTIPAAHQRSAICPSRQRLTLVEWLRQMEIMLSMALVERSVRASVRGTPSRSTVSVSASPSRRLAPALGGELGISRAGGANRARGTGAGLVQLPGQSGQLGFGLERGIGVVGRAHLLADRTPQPLRQAVLNVSDLVQLAALDHRGVEDVDHRLA